MAILELHTISKSFPGVMALSEVSFSVREGELHALCGENGAGKTTLMNILTGNLQPDNGFIQWKGERARFRNPQEAFASGIAIVYQHLSLCDNLSVAENIYANHQPVNRFGLIRPGELHRKTSRLLEILGIDLHPAKLVSALSPAHKQMVEIAKALSKNPSLLILDEPTASLTERETVTLFKILRQLREQKVSIIYISHRLTEILQLADRVSVLKDGRYQGTFPREELSKEKLIRLMVGRDLLDTTPSAYQSSEVLLDVANLTGKKFSDISFRLHKGEILGFAGLAGAGRTEIARTIIGIDEKHSGEVKIGNRVRNIRHPADAAACKIAYVPEERKTQGLFAEMSVQDNVIAADLRQATRRNLFHAATAESLAGKFIHKLGIVTPGAHQRVGNLSGGNQQKVLLAKWLMTRPEVLIVDEPTHGVDVGAKQEIYRILEELSAQGIGILLISSELPELLALCHRILVIRNGSIEGELSAEEATEEKILALATEN